jgi:acetate CoA/acetoacetate CoA-transferase beta subunit
VKRDAEAMKALIARRAARELRDGDVVNLGIGLPTLVADRLPAGVRIFLQSENGMIGMGPAPAKGEEDPCITDAGGRPVTLNLDGCFFDSALSFGLIRGGHVDVCILGALQVDQEGSLASWIIPGQLTPGMGGAMDLVAGARRVIVAMTHTAKGIPKILRKCTLPLTAAREVDLVVTELAVMEPAGQGMLIKEIHPETSVEEIRSLTEAELIVAEPLNYMAIESPYDEACSTRSVAPR